MRLAGRQRGGSQGGPCPGLDRQAVRLGGGLPLRRPSGPGVRWAGLHAREPGRTLLPGVARRPDLGGDLRDPAADRCPGPREAGRRAGCRRGMSADLPAATERPQIDLHALFAPRSVAVVGASPRWDIAPTVRDNLLTMGSSTRCYFAVSYTH